jgi:hypothetical protein
MQTGSRRRALDTLLDLSHVVLMTEVCEPGRVCRLHPQVDLSNPCLAATDSGCIHVSLLVKTAKTLVVSSRQRSHLDVVLCHCRSAVAACCWVW